MQRHYHVYSPQQIFIKLNLILLPCPIHLHLLQTYYKLRKLNPGNITKWYQHLRYEFNKVCFHSPELQRFLEFFLFKHLVISVLFFIVYEGF